MWILSHKKLSFTGIHSIQIQETIVAIIVPNIHNHVLYAEIINFSGLGVQILECDQFVQTMKT